jgi:hypothetical protein
MLELNAWDFGGQEVYRPTHQIFFTGPAVYVVVWKPRAGSQQGSVDYWLRMIRLRAPDGSRALVVASHGGPTDRQARLAQAELRATHGDLIAGFFSVDSEQQDERLQEVKDVIAAEAASLPEMGGEFPRSWADFRSALTPRRRESSAAPYYRYDQLVELASEAGLESTAAPAITAIASRRGQWIHYGSEPPAPTDLIVTRPDWLAQAFSYVLEDEPTWKNRGLLAVRRLAEIWNRADREFQYDEQLWPAFLRLMDSFDLAYQVDQTNAQETELGPLWLVAQLVPEDPEPAHEHLIEPAQNGRTYSETVEFFDRDTRKPEAAEGLFFRLIVRLHRYSLGAGDFTKAVHWQTGLRLRDPLLGEALITHAGATIRVETWGTRPDWFAQQIVGDIQRICDDFWEQLATERYVTCIEPCGLDKPGTALLPLADVLNNKYPTFQCRERGCRSEFNTKDLVSGHTASTDPLELQIEKRLAAMEASAERRHRESRRWLEDHEHHVRELVRSLTVDVDELSPSVTGRLLPYLEEHFDRIDARLTNLDADIRDIGAQLRRQIDVLLRSFNDLKGPRLIVPYLNEPRSLKRGWEKAELRLVLYCEHSRQPVWVLNGDDSLGRYSFSIGREQLRRWLPLASLTTKLLAGFVPLALFTTEEHLSKETWNRVKDELDLASKSINALSSSLGIADDQLGGSSPGIEDGRDLMDRGTLAQLHELIRNEGDPGFATLVPVVDRHTDQTLWVDRQFGSEYRATAN